MLANTNMEEVTKTKSLERGEVTETLEIAGAKIDFTELDEEVQISIQSALDKKAVNTTVLDLRPITSFTEFFVITGGTNQKHVQAIADEITTQLKKQTKFKPIRIEGYTKADWILLDFGDFIVHVFNEKSRAFYDLERLWRDAKKVELPEQD